MAAPNLGHVYYCRADVFANIAKSFEASDEVVEVLEDEGCKEGSRNPRQHCHIVCRGCRNKPQITNFYNAIYATQEIMRAWEVANLEDEQPTQPTQRRARSRSRTPPLSLEQIGRKRVDSCTFNELMAYIRSMR